MDDKSNKGIALIVALLTLLVISTIAATIMYTTQTEITTSYNYKRLAQARYSAESGIQKTINWFENSYTMPTNFSSNYDVTQYPVQNKSNGQAVVLSALTGTTANYPTSSVQTTFNTALNGQSIPGTSNATFSTYATLLGMTPGYGSSWAGTGNGLVPQTWQITSVGSIGTNAKVQLQATYERVGTPIFTYAIASVGTTCPSVNFTGGTLDSWNSANGGTYAGTVTNSGANIGTNGNVTLNVTVHGVISSSFNTNVGGCPTNGITNNAGGTPWDGLQTLSSALSYPSPPAPSPMTSTTNLNANSNTCWSGPPTGCTVIAGPALQIVPGSYGNITSNSNIHLTAGTYNINSLSMNGGSITLDSTPVVINLGGNGVSSGGTLFTANSSTTINDGGIPANLQIISAAGAGMSNPPVITMNSSSAMYATVYAPNAYVHITGSSQFLGAVVGQKVTCDSSGGFHFDKGLNDSMLNVSPAFVPISFTWSKF